MRLGAGTARFECDRDGLEQFLLYFLTSRILLSEPQA
jgi:hypothetical protein